jgi:hypothetical protein
LIGAALPVAGSIFVLEWQRTREIRNRRALLLELLDDVEAECIPFQCANEPALRERYGRTVDEQAKELRRAIGRVHTFRTTMEPKTALMMRVSDVVADLSFDGGAVNGSLDAIRMYPIDGDLGALNTAAHDVLGAVSKAKRLLKG